MKKLLLFLSILFIFANVVAQKNDNQSLIEPVSETIDKVSFFDNQEPLNLTLKYDITSFIRNKNKEEYLDALFILHLSKTDSIVKNIRLKSRGNFRKGHCFFPPIYLNFKTDPIQQTDLKGIKKIKLVTHCSLSKTYQDYILKEYLAYRIYNLLSDKSFRVKLVNVNYIDTGKKGRNYKKQGFLIEPLELLTKRTNSVEVDSKFVLGNNIIEPDMSRVAVFEYLIANTDWRFKRGHNMKYIKSLDVVSPKVIPVPYDFDYAGFVDASYAVPQEWTSLKSVTDREYLGYCPTSDEQLLQIIDLFLQNKENIYSLIHDFPFLNDKEKKRLLGFVENFYASADSPRDLLNIIKRECRDLEF